MREIKFRFVFKHPESGQTIISRSYTIDELVDQDNVYTTYNIQDECCVCDCQPEGETNVIECNCSDYYDKFEPIDRIEWSGLRDEHGVEIYEHDYVRFTYSCHDTAMNRLNIERLMFVKWMGSGFHLLDNNGCINLDHVHELKIRGFGDALFEVIGNRFQHPELLNAK